MIGKPALTAIFHGTRVFVLLLQLMEREYQMNKMRNTLMAAFAVCGMIFGGAAMADDTSKSVKKESKSEYKAAVDSAEADYKVAKERCDTLQGNEKDVCVKEAKAVEKKAKADAKAQHKTVTAQANAGEDKREVAYKAAKEKCDSLSGNAKDSCVADAKAKYGQ